MSGNCGSAFISLCVSRSSFSDMKDLLPCSALMTIQDSKSEQNKNCVKIYNKEDFLKETRDEKWDQLRVTVTQPFNLHMQFGLCFLRLFSFTDEANKIVTTPLNFSEWRKMNESNNSSSPRSSLSNKTLTRRDRLFLEAGQQPIRCLEKEKSTKEEECEIEVDEAVFEISVMRFLKSLNLTENDFDKLQLLDLRKKNGKTQWSRIFFYRKTHICELCKEICEIV
ncbi:hypothetical protein L9F63_001179 [Diploptera punctata]|uniref:DNA-repair protein Xrcc1 N-terminal domain-containing protein n=1 Tax=Diploptera punctata TaxID=6984 RepID=A0AAD8A6F4_DIPPU|nr:hypothetical protein L9F63_001179 [Diploptera punctata]